MKRREKEPMPSLHRPRRAKRRRRRERRLRKREVREKVKAMTGNGWREMES